MDIKAIVPLITVLVFACISSPADAAKPGATSRTTVGIVERTETVQLDSNAGKGALVGGTLGLLSAKGKSGSKKARNTIIGAAAGGAIAGASQGDTRGRKYTVRTGEGSLMSIVSDQKEVRVGDCVVVEEFGSTANIRRVSQTMCQTESAAVVQQIGPELRNDARECAEAKQQLVDANTAADVDLAMRKVQILCDD
jgi:outer membrane lipoprotein SlyB